MAEALTYLTQFNMLSVTLRLILAMLFGGMIGIERARKHRAAGFRTYMIVCLGAALAVLISEYEYAMLEGPWSALAEAASDSHIDASRIGAEVVGGVGFLAAGTIILTGHQEIRGMTTAAGLWASACAGLAVGAGFYQCVFLGFVLIYLCIRLLPRIEAVMIRHTRNVNIYIEFHSLNDLGDIIARIKEQGAQIYEVDINHTGIIHELRPSAVFYVRLPGHRLHEDVLAALSELEHVTMIDEI